MSKGKIVISQSYICLVNIEEATNKEKAMFWIGKDKYAKILEAIEVSEAMGHGVTEIEL